VSDIILYDKKIEQYTGLPNGNVRYTRAKSVEEAVCKADCVLLSVKPQNYPEILSEISRVADHSKKLYISIGAGITSQSVSESLSGACVVRVLPNVPMLIGEGVSVICRNVAANAEDFDFVDSVFASAGSTVLIDESEMNRMIGVTSSSPAYVFKFINAMYLSALEQGLSSDGLIDAICDTVIGSALLLKGSNDTPDELISKVASKGGTTERAIFELENHNFSDGVISAMQKCTDRADELGKS
jgi:pyrroline-5-carboxylate reductase